MTSSESLSSASWLRVATPHFGILVNPRNTERLHALACQLPADCLAAVELRLAAEDHGVDLSIRLEEAQQARAMADALEGHPDRSSQPPRIDCNSLLRSWGLGEPDAIPMHSLWLEFDLHRDPGALPMPVVCACLHRDFELRWLEDWLLPRLLAKPPSQAQRRLLAEACATLPEGARLLYVFGLGARGSQAFRLEIFGLGPTEAAPYLDRLGAPEAGASVARLEPLLGDSERQLISFDLSNVIEGRIGVEAAYARLPAREPRWAQLLDRLVEGGLCSCEKRDAILAWPGYDTRLSAGDRWPGAAGTKSLPSGTCVRLLSHIKLVVSPEQSVTAKAYLFYQHLQRKYGGGTTRPS